MCSEKAKQQNKADLSKRHSFEKAVKRTWEIHEIAQQNWFSLIYFAFIALVQLFPVNKDNWPTAKWSVRNLGSAKFLPSANEVARR